MATTARNENEMEDPRPEIEREARMNRERDRQEKAQALVAREVLCCVSIIVHGLANSEEACAAMGLDMYEDVYPLCQRDDWQTAAEEEGWRWGGVDDDGTSHFVHETERWYTDVDHPTESWRELCEAHDIDPHYVEAFEHWAVSDWFGRRLADAGEMVAFDFAGLPAVWGRTCTGQAVALDDVVQRIACDGAG